MLRSMKPTSEKRSKSSVPEASAMHASITASDNSKTCCAKPLHTATPLKLLSEFLVFWDKHTGALCSGKQV